MNRLTNWNRGSSFKFKTTALIAVSAGIFALWAAVAWADKDETVEWARPVSGEEALLELPYQYISVGWLDWATVQVREISDARPDMVEAHLLWGLASEAGGDGHDARLAYERAVAGAEGDQAVRSAALTLLGRLLARGGASSAGKQLLLQAVELNDAAAMAYFELGRISEGEGDEEEALTWYQRATETASDWLEPALNYAGIFNRRQQYDRALKLLLAKKSLAERRPDFHYELALGYTGLYEMIQEESAAEDWADLLASLSIGEDNVSETLKQRALHAIDRARQLGLNMQDARLKSIQSRLNDR